MRTSISCFSSLSAKTGKTYRLPTEAEWEYAARAGSSALFSFGDDVGALGQYAWYGLNSGGHIHPVGQKEPNKFGLHDMHGNVWEWVLGGTPDKRILRGNAHIRLKKEL
jgi:formylglycine-generating enzyme required for sulfatase activity